jgi:hypothetical protein
VATHTCTGYGAGSGRDDGIDVRTLFSFSLGVVYPKLHLISNLKLMCVLLVVKCFLWFWIKYLNKLEP